MIFAAGRGTRLGELGASTPKALLELAGVTMLERTAHALVAAGADRLVVNVHHHAGAIEAFLAAHDLGVEVRVSREVAEPLETGGGLLHARAHFRGDRAVLAHNVDVVCDTDLRPLVAAHAAGSALVTLAVQARDTQRFLLFDDAGLCGRENRRTGQRTEVRAPRGEVRSLAFAGIHACAPALFDLVSERGVFPIVDVWLRLAAAGHLIRPWLVPAGAWFEVGSPERLAVARARFEAR